MWATTSGPNAKVKARTQKSFEAQIRTKKAQKFGQWAETRASLERKV